MKQLAVSRITDKGITVLGPYTPEKYRYTTLAKNLGASYFDIGPANWEKLVKLDVDVWKFNKLFLDEIIKKNQKIMLSISRDKIRRTSYLRKEIDYLKKNGYSFIDDKTMIKETKK